MDAQTELTNEVDALVASIRSGDVEGFGLLWDSMSEAWRKAAAFRMARTLADR
jgi:hypothetical protein